MTKTEQVIQAANVAYEKYEELEKKVGRVEAGRISFEVLQMEMEKLNNETNN